MNKEQANQALSEKRKQMEALLKEMTTLADEHGLTFSFSLGDAINVDRRIGGEYYGKGNTSHDGFYTTDGWDSSTIVEEGEALEEGLWEAWQSSSEMC